MDNTSYLRYLAGDDSAFEEILINYRDGLMLYLCTLVHDLNTAEELCEEVFVKLAVRRPGFREKAQFKTWLYTIGRNCAISYLRKKALLRETSMQELPENLEQKISLEQSYYLSERRLAVHHALGALKTDYKDVLSLVYLEGFSNKQAAHIMHKTRRQIENLLYRAKNSLRKQLLKEGFVYEEL